MIVAMAAGSGTIPAGRCRSRCSRRSRTRSCGVDDAGVAVGAADPGHSGRARLDRDDRCRPVATLFRGPCNIRLFLAVPGLYRVLHDGAAAAGGRLYSDYGPAGALFCSCSTACRSVCTICSWTRSTLPASSLSRCFLTFLVTHPTLLTVFTITASFEIAGRLRADGLSGWLRALPLDRPMVLVTGLAFFMLWFGGGGGLINMSYGMNAMVHNTSVGHRAFPSDLRRHGRDHVFRDRLRDLAGADRGAPMRRRWRRSGGSSGCG